MDIFLRINCRYATKYSRYAVFEIKLHYRMVFYMRQEIPVKDTLNRYIG